MTHADPKAIEVAVLAVLMGNPATEIAEQMSLLVDDLLTAADLYRTAGYAALKDRGRRDGWQQVRIDFADWHTAEQIGITRLRPALAQAETDRILTSTPWPSEATSPAGARPSTKWRPMPSADTTGWNWPTSCSTPTAPPSWNTSPTPTPSR